MNNKDGLRQKRKEAYQMAKAKRDADPRYQALKEKVKQDRKAKYRAFQDQQKKAKLEAKEKLQAEKDAARMAFVMGASELETKKQYKIPHGKKPGTTLCVYTNYESDHTSDYTYFIGEEGDSFLTIVKNE